MRILKYIALALLGYALYEGYKMLYARSQGSGEAVAGPNPDLKKALNADAGRMSVLTGPDRDAQESGRVVSTVNADGASSPTVVGRGVIHR